MIFRKNRIKLLKTEGAFVGQLGWFYPIVGIGISIKEWTSVLLLTDITSDEHEFALSTHALDGRIVCVSTFL